MGKNNVNKRFTVDLEISTSDAEKKVRATVGNLKTILSDLGNASDKMGYFKELVDYISQIDKALVALKVKHGDTFNNLFDGLDVSLKGEMEKLFGTTSEVMNAVEMIRSQIEDAGKNKTSVGNLRKIATAINDLFSDLGIDEQINIDKYFKGSGDLQARLSILNDALDKFATTWTNVNAKVKQGFGVGGNGNTGLSEGVKREVDALNEQIRKLQEAKQKVEDLKKTIQNIKTKGDSAISDVYSIDVSSTESVKNLMDEFDRLNAEIQSGDKTTAEYYLNLVRITEAALSLKKALKDIRANDSIKQQYINEVGGAGFSGTLLGKLSTYANQKTTGALDSIFNVKIGKGIDDVISAILVKIQDLKSNDTGSGSGGSGSGDGNGTGITKAEFSALETAIKTGIDTLSQKLDGTLKVELTNEVVKSTIDNVEDVVNSIVGELKSENASDDNGNLQSLLDTLGSLSDSITSLVDNLNSNVNADTNGGGVKYDSISGRMFHGTRVKWTGDVYDPNREKAAAFGAALYVTPDEKAVKNYGSAEIKELEFSLDKCFIITKDYITSLGDIYKAMGTTVPEGADIQKALSDMRSYCRASIDNSKAFKQEMLSMGYQGMYVGDNLNNIKMKEEVAIYDEKVLKKLKSYTGAEFTEKGITGVVDVNIVGGAEVIQDSLRSDVSDSGDKQAITIDAELDNAVNQVIAALNRLQESIDGTASYIQGVAESVTKDIDGGKNNDAINSNVTDAVGTQAIEQQSWTERAESIQNITAALDKQKVSYEELIAAVNAYKDAYEIMQKFTPDGGLGLELMNNLRTKFKFGQNLDLIDTDNWSRLLEGKISAEEIAIQLKPYLDESNLKKEKSVLKKDFKQYVQSLVDTGDFSLRDDTDLDMWDSIEEGIKEGTLTTLDQCVTKFKELKAITEAAEESTDAENASLERKLELLRDIAEQYANDITQRDRNTYERLNDKEMESGLTSKEEVRYSKLGEKISDADEQLEQFGETYDKILLKLANGKTIEILPEDAGLRKFDKIANEFYQGEYDGIEIEDVIFMRKQEQSVIEQNNQELQKQLDIQEQIATAQGRASGPQQAEIVADNEKAITSYEELCQVVKRYNELCLKSFAEGQTLTDADRVEKSRIEDKFMATKGVLGDPDKLVDYIISMQRLAGLMGEYDTNRLAKYFGIEIPQAADKATEAIQEVTQATESSSIPQDTSASTAKYEAETKVVKQQNEELEINQQLKAQEGTLDTNSSVIGDTTQELNQLNDLHDKLVAVKEAVEAKTQAFEEEYVTVDAAVNAEIESLNKLKALLDEIQNILQIIFATDAQKIGDIDLSQDKTSGNAMSTVLQNIQQILGQIYGVLQGFTGIEADGKNSLKYKEPVADNGSITSDTYQLLSSKLSNDLATEGTLTAVKGAIEQLADSIKTKNTSDDSQNNDIKQSIGTMISALTENIKALKDATNGVIDQQKAQKTDTTAAMARIKDKQQYDIISNTATMSIGDLGTETQIKGLTALANGLVKVEGAFKNAEGEWEGFTVKVNKSNEAVDLATNKQSAFAKALNKVKDEISEVDDNPVKYNPDETYKKALEHMKELNAAGKNATLQYQDSGRYTVSSKEQVGGLSKEIFTTFDEFQKVMSRTTVTLSNDIASSIRDANKLISDNTDKVGNEGLLKQYNDEYANLIAMNQKYESMDNLSQDDIAVWNSKITLVQRLGNEVSGLIKQQQKLEGQSGIATSAKRLQEYQTEADKVFKELDFGLTTENKTDVQQKIVGIYDQIIEKINLLKKNHSILTESQQSEINGLLKSLKEEANAYNEANKSVEEIKEEPQTEVKKKKTAEETVDIKNNIDELKQLTAQLKKAKQDLDFTFSDQNLNDDQQGIVTSYKEAQIEIKKLEEAVENGEQVELGSIQATISALQTKIAQYKQANNLMSASEKQSNASSLKTKLTGSINTLDFKVDSGNLTDEQQSIANKYKELNNLLQQYGRNASEVSQEEYNNTIQRVVALNQEIAAYKKKYNIANARGGTQTSTYGTTQVLNATSKYNSLLSDAKALGMSESSTAVQNYTNALQNLVKAQQAFKAGEDTTSEVGKAKVQAFKDAQIECSKYAKELNNVVTASKKLASNGSDTYKLGKDFEDTKSGRESALRGYIESLGDANIEIGKFQNASNELTYTIKNSDGSFTQMTATINAARTAIVATTGDTKTATSAFGNFISELKNKAKGITTYLISMTGFQEVFQQLRQGVQYVKEIDSALTELKKVTDETDATYERFLQTMSKTAGVVGSTVSELTTMASEWARLGYSIEEAGQLAESTAILLNVSEFENATDASEALISTMQAFQYTADESQHVVDILNEVGKLLPNSIVICYKKVAITVKS